jgi:hypothetical protein
VPDPEADNEETIIETRPPDPHLGVDEIARLLEGRVGEIERAAILAHLETCRQCRELYLDSAVEVGFQRVGSPSYSSSKKTEELVGLGMRVPAQSADASRPRGGGPERVSAPGFWTGWRIRAAAVAASVVFVAAAGWYGARVYQQNRVSVLGSEVLQPIQAAVGEFSRQNEVVLPGGESYLDDDAPVFRSLRGSMNDPLCAHLKGLLEEFDGGSPSPDLAYWAVAGYLASGDVRTASIYVARARERFPEDPRLQVLDGVVAYCDGDLPKAERLLREFVKSSPEESASGPRGDSLTAIAQLNLALVLRDQRNFSEAREILSGVRSRHAGTPIGERAGEIEATLGG